MTTKQVTLGAKEITFDKELLEEFKIAYNKALEETQPIFVFYDNEFVVGYAKYLIQYLEPLLV